MAPSLEELKSEDVLCIEDSEHVATESCRWKEFRITYISADEFGCEILQGL